MRVDDIRPWQESAGSECRSWASYAVVLMCQVTRTLHAMVARFTSAGLGLLAFAVTTIAGLAVQNPVTVTLSRSILALFLFCLLGFAVGAAAQAVVRDHERRRAFETRARYPEGDRSPAGVTQEASAAGADGAGASA